MAPLLISYVKKEIVGHSDKLKLLGVTIDNQLNFSENISQLCQKASQQVGVLMRIKKVRT